MVLDHRTSRLWVATQNAVTAYDAVSGDAVSSIELASRDRVRDLSVDASRHVLWLALKDRLLTYTDGTVDLELPLQNLEQVERDGAGGAWLATKKELFHLDALGEVLSSTEPFGGQGTIGELAVGFDGTAWVANRTRIAHVGEGGEVLDLLTFEPPVRIWDLATAEDTIPPVLEFTAPANGASIDHPLPSLALAYNDGETGVDSATLTIAFGSLELAVQCETDSGGAVCELSDPLPEGPVTLTASVEDQAGNVSEPASVSFEIDTTPPLDLPPDPTTVAPSLDRTVVTDVFSATEFLYTGDAPIQTGVEPGTIERRRAAVVRGQVLDRDGNPLPGVDVTVLDHPEFGATRSRADGVFDLAVNGGGQLIVDYRKDGFLPAQRPVDVPWRDYAWADDLVMIPLDAAVSEIAAGATGVQVARGTPQTDADGTRTATLIFQPGT
ncbi:MAG: carboxypeptidase regulatory-like domain-containing protein, partial [Thermoanaerobaculia bacterium]